MAAFDLKYYADVFLRIDDIFVRLLNRPADMGGLVNWFWHWRENGASFEWIEDQIKASPEYAEVHKPRPNLPRLVNRGGFFATETGERFTVIGCSDFNLFTSYLMMGHQYARDIMAERSAIGFNWLRVWLAYWDTNTNGGIPGIGKLNPADHSGMYGRLAPFCAIASEYGLHLVRVSQRVEKRAPLLAEVLEAVKRDWLRDQLAEANERYYADLHAKYPVRIEYSRMAAVQ